MRSTVTVLLMAVGLLLMLGAVMLLSASVQEPSPYRLTPHLWSMGLGLFCLVAAATFDYAWLRHRRLPLWFLGISMVLLLAVLMPQVGTRINGARRWLFGGQPSELAKLALIIFLADYAARHQGRMDSRRLGFACPAAVGGLIVALVFAEPDWGGAFLIAAVAFAMLVVAGGSWWYFMSAGIIGAELGVLFLLGNWLRTVRVLAFLDPETYKSGAGWQAWISQRAMAHGGFWGTFPGEGSYKNGLVPEQQTDFVLSLIGEELGLPGTWLVLLLFAAIVICGSRIAWRVVDPFGKMLAFGVTFLIGMQALMNVCVVTSCVPDKGIALPFVSYGGSNLVVMLTCAGLLLNLARRGPFAAPPPPLQSEFDFPGKPRPRPTRSFQALPKKRLHR
jgi:cell division protein FtsW